jgi:putative exosortase-associated protein (TIGR04073 family)
MLLYIQCLRDKLEQQSFLEPMKPSFAISMFAVLVAVVATGCAGPEKKFGRGLANVTEVIRMGEVQREIEQAGVFGSPTDAYTTGLVKGINKTLVRTGVGAYEMVTFPIPTYDPIFTGYLTPKPAHPANNPPGLPAGPAFDTDTSLGFSGGEIAPLVPGSRYHIFAQPH